jgi:hypothetical protein
VSYSYSGLKGKQARAGNENENDKEGSKEIMTGSVNKLHDKIIAAFIKR